MSFQLNLVALTESARGHLARLDASGSAICDRFRSPPPHSSSNISSVPPDTAAGVSFEVDVSPSSESTIVSRLTGGGGELHYSLCLR